MRLIVLLAFFSFTLNAVAQESVALEPVGMLLTEDEYKDMEGSPYVAEEWLEATIRVDSTTIYEKVRIRLNVYANRVHFKDANGQVRVVVGKVNEVKITDPSSSLKSSRFIAGIAPQKSVFYRVLSEGPKMQLLEKLTGRKTDTRVLHGEAKLQIDIEKELYVNVLSTGLMFKGEKKCSSLGELYNSDKKLSDFIDKNGYRCNKKEDLIKVVEFYNSY